ncbi:MAG: hypothetical protein JWM38_1708 [Sphingomonas bacterium]|nr:hypothetical protein [Sphingomonas bacterium]
MAKSLVRSALLVAAAALSSAAPAPAQTAARPQSPIAVPCERACMERVVDQFLKAMAAHDAKSLPLADNARYTEMGQEMGFDDGLWRTASAVGGYRHVLADPATGQMAFFATMKENGRSFVMGGRLKLEIGRIAEAEVILYRTGSGPAWNDKGVETLEKMAGPKTMWTDIVPAGRRKSRQELVRTANFYFEAIQNNDGRGYYPFTDDCDRFENGVYTTNNPGLVKMGTVDIGGMGCKAQFSTGLYGIVTRVHHRRLMVVDEERQTVFAVIVFDHGGFKKSLTTPQGQTVDTGFFSKPSSILLAEAFKIKGDLIQQVEAVGTGVPYHMHPGWGER